MQPWKRIERAAFYSPHLQLVYLRIPKVACSSFKRSIWHAVDHKLGEVTLKSGVSPHDKAKSPFAKSADEIRSQIDSFVNASFFTVVRNPYSRLLSAFLDKVTKKNRDLNVWSVIRKQLSYNDDDYPDFSDFVDRLVKQRPSYLENHFLEQNIVICSNHLPVDHLGHMESLGSTSSFLGIFGVPIRNHRSHSTGSTSRIKEFYTRKELDSVQRFFRKDFELFGYSDDPDILAPTLKPQFEPVSRDNLSDKLDRLLSQKHDSI